MRRDDKALLLITTLFLWGSACGEETLGSIEETSTSTPDVVSSDSSAILRIVNDYADAYFSVTYEPAESDYVADEIIVTENLRIEARQSKILYDAIHAPDGDGILIHFTALAVDLRYSFTFNPIATEMHADGIYEIVYDYDLDFVIRHGWSS